MLKVFLIDVSALLDSGATLSFVIPLIAKKFEISPDILNEHFIVSTQWVSRLVQRRYMEIVL